MKELIEFLKSIISNPSIFIIGTFTLIEIAPIKLNPWKFIFSWIGKVLNSEDRTNIMEIRKELSELKRDFETNKAEEKRWHILDFVNTCRKGNKHTREEWNHVISELTEYENYTVEKNISNGVIEEDSKYLRNLFQECNKNNDFL